MLAHVTPSTEGLRLFFIIPDGMDLAQAQKWMSEQLGDENYDQSVKDLARSSFVVPEEYVLYIDEECLFAEKFTTEDTEYHGGNKLEENNVDNKEENKNPPCASVPSVVNPEPLTFKGVPYAEIIARWFALAGGEPVQGERNDKLHRLASHLRYITDNDEKILLQIMPRYGLSEEEMKGLIHSACSAKWFTMPKMLQEALALSKSNTETQRHEEFFLEGSDNEKLCASVPLCSFPPEMPEKLPALIKLLVSRTPDVYKPAVAHAVFPPLATHLHKVRFRYIDNVEHEATLMNVLMAGTGAGKDCISEPINRIMADIRRRDEENLRREREWKNEVNSKGSNKDKRQRPEGLVIQEIDADMTNPAFVLRTAEAEGHFLYTKLNEIDQFDALRGSGRETSSSKSCVWLLTPETATGRPVWGRNPSRRKSRFVSTGMPLQLS